MKDYESEELAQNEFDKMKQGMMKLMCPIYKTECIVNKCMSFAGKVYSVKLYQKPEIFRIREPHCCNAIVTGYIEMEGLS